MLYFANPDVALQGDAAEDRKGEAAETKMTEGRLTGTIEEVAEKARRILTSICPEAWCQEQDWDNRIDCGVKQPDGQVAAEMILLRDATETRIRECADRLLLRRQGVLVALKDEIPPPIFLGGGSGESHI